MLLILWSYFVPNVDALLALMLTVRCDSLARSTVLSGCVHITSSHLISSHLVCTAGCAVVGRSHANCVALQRTIHRCYDQLQLAQPSSDEIKLFEMRSPLAPLASPSNNTP